MLGDSNCQRIHRLKQSERLRSCPNRFAHLFPDIIVAAPRKIALQQTKTAKKRHVDTQFRILRPSKTTQERIERHVKGLQSERRRGTKTSLCNQNRISWYSFATHHIQKHLAKQREAPYLYKYPSLNLQVLLTLTTLSLLIDEIRANGNHLTAYNHKCKFTKSNGATIDCSHHATVIGSDFVSKS